MRGPRSRDNHHHRRSKLSQIEQNIAALDGEPIGAEVIEQCDVVCKTLAGTHFAHNR